MKHEITIYTDCIYDDHKTIEDPVEIARTIKSYISHLGKFDIYIKPKPKTIWQKLINSLG